MTTPPTGVGLCPRGPEGACDDSWGVWTPPQQVAPALGGSGPPPPAGGASSWGVESHCAREGSQRPLHRYDVGWPCNLPPSRPPGRNLMLVGGEITCFSSRTHMCRLHVAAHMSADVRARGATVIDVCECAEVHSCVHRTVLACAVLSCILEL